jgi:hypothetical protein
MSIKPDVRRHQNPCEISSSRTYGCQIIEARSSQSPSLTEARNPESVLVQPSGTPARPGP